MSIPMDLMMNDCDMHLATPVIPPYLGASNKRNMDKAAEALNGASMPLVLCGGMASSPDAVVALRALLASHPIPVISTFQGTGTVSKEMAHLYCGRVGLTKNQPADRLLDEADVILAIGYDVIEYDASIWNTTGMKKTIIHLDHTARLTLEEQVVAILDGTSWVVSMHHGVVHIVVTVTSLFVSLLG